MTRKPQKDEEQAVLDLLRAQCAEFPGGSLRPSDPPDFVLTTETGRRVGLEMRRLFPDQSKDGSPRQRGEMLHEKIVHHAERDHVAASGSPLAVAVFWSSNDIVSGDTAVLARELHDLVIGAMPRLAPQPGDYPGALRCVLDWNELQSAALGLYATQVTVATYPGVRSSTWDSVEVGWLWLPVDAIRKAIAEKERTLSGWQTSVDEAWLVLYLVTASSGRITDDIRNASYPSAFNRIYLFDTISREWVRIDILGTGWP